MPSSWGWWENGYRVVFVGGEAHLVLRAGIDPSSPVYFREVRGGLWMGSEDVRDGSWRALPLRDLPAALRQRLEGRDCYCYRGVRICDFCAGLREPPRRCDACGALAEAAEPRRGSAPVLCAACAARRIADAMGAAAADEMRRTTT